MLKNCLPWKDSYKNGLRTRLAPPAKQISLSPDLKVSIALPIEIMEAEHPVLDVNEGPIVPKKLATRDEAFASDVPR